MDSHVRDQCESMQNMLEALIRHGIVQEDEITGSADSIVTVETLWNLFRKCEAKFEEAAEHQNIELIEVQKYVDSVRTLSEERDCLNDQFERENEKLKGELKETKRKADNELSEVATMCQQENLDELIGSSFSEQMAYLLVVRATLLDKIEVLHEEHNGVLQQRNHLEALVKKMSSEDEEMRARMEVAMGEMGGMTSKLNNTLFERDALKKKVAELTQALDGIQELPALREAKVELATQAHERDCLRSFYSEERKKLHAELEESNHRREGEVASLTKQIEELQEENLNLKEMNRTLNEQLVGKLFECDRAKVYSESQKIIEEMQSALEEDEAQSREQQAGYEGTIKMLNLRIKELESHHQEQALKRDEFLQSTKWEEKQCQRDELCNRIAEMESDLRDARREVGMCNAAYKSKKEQLETQIRITNQLKNRNSSLELQLTKVLRRFQVSSDRSNRIEHEQIMSGRELVHPDADGRDVSAIGQLQDKISHLEELLMRDTSGTTDNNQLASHELEDENTSLRTRIATMSEGEVVLQKRLKEVHQRATDAEAQLLLVKGGKNTSETQKLMAELDRTQLEDAVDLMRKRVEFYITQLQSYANRYKNLKQKHKTKIRRIRELFLVERKYTSEESERLERRLASAESALERELAWKDEAAGEVRTAERERRSAINRANSAIQKMDERGEYIKKLNSTRDDLESENKLLQKQLSLLEQQKIELERLIESNQRKQHKEELTTLLSSLTISLDPPDLNNNQATTPNATPTTGVGALISSYITLPESDHPPVAAKRIMK